MSTPNEENGEKDENVRSEKSTKINRIRAKMKTTKKEKDGKTKTTSGRERYRDMKAKRKGAVLRGKSRSRSRSRSKSRARKAKGGTRFINTAKVDGRIAEIIGYETPKAHRSGQANQKGRISPSTTQFYSSENTSMKSQEFLRNLSGSFDGSDTDSIPRVFSSFDDENEEGRVSVKRGGISVARSKKSQKSRKSAASKRSPGAPPGLTYPKEPPLRPHRRYRGFTSSIAALFQDEQIVCGAIACFGILLSQRTEYLLNARNIRRGLSRKRTPSTHLAYSLAFLLISVALTYAIWGITGIGAGNSGNWGNNDDANINYDDYYNDNNNNNNNRRLIMRGQYKLHEWHSLLWSNSGIIDVPRLLENAYNYDDRYQDDYNETINESNPGDFPRSILFFLFLFLLGVVGRRRRMRTRYEIIKARAQDDHLFYVEGEIDAVYDTREDKYEAACSHTLCGCYPVDQDDDLDDESALTPNTFSSPPPNLQNKDLIQNMYDCVSLSCCGKIFKCWIQCFSTCALAQEAREARLLVPPKLQKVDYLTHQPFYEYHQRITDLRKRSIEDVMNHAKSLSNLSKYLIFAFICVAILISMTLLFNPRSSFGVGNLVVVLTTFGVSFMLLFILHWMIHRSDLGLDAVVKMFSAGFLIGVPTAFIFEALFVNFSIAFLYLFYGFLDLVKANFFFDFLQNHPRFAWIWSELFQAFFVAAFIEETCKYYTFRSIEHPDLMFITEDDRYKQIQNTSMGSLYPIAPIMSSDDDSVTQGGSRARSRRKNDDKKAQEVIEMVEDGPDERSPIQMAGAVTVAIVSVALGLACAENFLYVFLLSDATVMQEGMILFFRSIFPVHALAGAIQSIGVIKKYIEKDETVGVGKIIFPAILMHGSFDAILMILNAFEEEPWNYYTEEEVNYSVPLAVSIIFWIGVVCVVIYGIYYYRKESEKQRMRLMNIEEYYDHMHRGYEEGKRSSNQVNKSERYNPPVQSIPIV